MRTPIAGVPAGRRRGSASWQGCAGQGPGSQPRPTRKQVLAWADIRNGVQHDSSSRARWSRSSGWAGSRARSTPTSGPTRSRSPRNRSLRPAGNRHRPITSKNLDYFDAIFFFGLREIDLTPEQKADFLAFVKEDGKGFVAAHSATTASSRGRSSARCWAGASTSIPGTSPTPRS